MNIEKANASMTKDLVDLFNEATRLKLQRGDTSWGEPNYNEKEVSKLQGFGNMYVALDDNSTLVGTVSLSTSDTRNWGEIQGNDGTAIYVHKLARVQAVKSVGTALLKWVEEQALNTEAEVLRLNCGATNEKLCAFYQSLGFNAVRDIPYENGHPSRLFEKKIK